MKSSRDFNLLSWHVAPSNSLCMAAAKPTILGLIEAPNANRLDKFSPQTTQQGELISIIKVWQREYKKIQVG